MVTYYTEKDLVQFGTQLLSKEREDEIKEANPETFDIDKRNVSHSDVENFKQTL